MKRPVPFIKKNSNQYTKKLNDNQNNADENTDFYEDPSKAFHVVDSQQQQLNDNQNNTDQYTESNEDHSDNINVINSQQLPGSPWLLTLNFRGIVRLLLLLLFIIILLRDAFRVTCSIMF